MQRPLFPFNQGAATTQTTGSRREHFVTLDCLRGFAALVVCLFHYTGAALPKLAIPAIGSAFAWGRFGVEVFFVISGFIIPYVMMKGRYARRDAPTFLLKRFIRIALPAYVVIALTLGQFWAIDHLLGSSNGWFSAVTFPQVAANIAFVVPFTSTKWLVGVFWTLAVEFQFYVLLALAFPWVFRSTKSFLVIAAIVIAFSVLPVWPKESFAPFASYFLIGGACLFYRNGQISTPWFVALLSGLGVPSLLTGQIVALSLALATAAAILWLDLRSKPWRFLGKISYSLYLTHILFGSTAENLLLRVHYPTSAIEAVASQLLILAGAVAFAWAFHVVIETPALHLSQRVASRARAKTLDRTVPLPSL